MVICVFGDSIAKGMIDIKKGGWVNRYKEYFESKNKENIVYNLGIPGNTISDLIKRFEREIKDKKVDVLVFAIGINDVSKNKIDFKKNVNRLYKMAKKYSSNIVFVGLTRVDERKTKVLSFFAGKKYTNSRIEKLDRIIENYCQKNGIKYICVEDLLNKDDLVDGLHPNVSGHRKLYKKIKTELEEYLKI